MKLEMEKALNEAAESLGIKKLKEEHMDAMLAFASGCDVFGSLLTDYGKSICYNYLPGLVSSLCTNGGSCANYTESFSIVIIISYNM